jgi:DNA-binding protein HU-beta
MIASLVSAMTDRLTDGDTLSIVNFGHFEVKKKAERLSVHPATQQRMLIPPKLVLTFRPSTTMKDKIK